MSGGKCCDCSERTEPFEGLPASKPNRPGRLWRVLQYRCNHSAFNGYHHTHSRYSSIVCLRCGSTWRTKAPYADGLSFVADHERQISSGYAGHAEAMESRGREPHR